MNEPIPEQGYDEYMEGLRRSIIEVEDKDRNFDITTKGGLFRSDIILQRKTDNHSIALSDFLPPGYKFMTGKEFAMNEFGQTIFYPKEGLNYRGSVLALLHEVGHAYMGEKESNLSTMEEVRALVETIYRKIRYHNADLSKFPRGFNNPRYDIDILAPLWYKANEFQLLSQEERGTWAFALCAARKLQRSGFTVFSGFGNFSEIKKYINFCLGTYEIRRYLEFRATKGIEGKQYTSDEFPPLFVRHMKVKKENKL